MMVQEDAVADDAVRVQRADPIQPLDRCQPMAADHLVELGDALGGVDLERQVAFSCIGVAVGDQLC